VPVQPVGVSVHLGSKQFPRLLAVRSNPSLGGGVKNAFKNESPPVEDLSRIQNILSVLHLDQTALLDEDFDVGAVQFLHGEGVGILEDPFVARVDPVYDEVHLRRSKTESPALSLEVRRVHQKRLTDERAMQFGEVGQHLV